MKKVSVKDLIIGALIALLFMMLLGAGPNDNKVGRFTSSGGAAGSAIDGWGFVCVTDTLTGDTRCRRGDGSGRRVGWGLFTFTPDFSKE